MASKSGIRRSLALAGLAAAALAGPALGSLRVADASTVAHAPRPNVTVAAEPEVMYPTLDSTTARRSALRAAAVGPDPVLPLIYGGGIDHIGVTTGRPKVYLVFWGLPWGSPSPTRANNSTSLSHDPAGEAPLLRALFRGLGTDGEQWSGVMTQYCEGVAPGATTCPASAAHVGFPSAGGALAGVLDDTGNPVPQSPTFTQLANEATRAAAHFGNKTPASNRNVQYVIALPHGITPAGFETQYCAWHSATSTRYGDLPFTSLPYIPDAGATCGAGFVNGANGALDGVTIVEGHEYAETITDQVPNGGWTDANGDEVADKCAWNDAAGPAGAQNVTFATGSFPMQATWSNDADACEIAHPIVTNAHRVGVHHPAEIKAATGTHRETR